MTNELVFPILVFDKKTKRMIALDYKYLMGDVRYIHVAFKGAVIIDSEGKVFKVKGVEKASGIKWWSSILKVGLMVKLKPILDSPIEHINLEELKHKIMEHVEKHPNHWLALDTVEGIQEMINQAQTFAEVIRIFK
jgi:hypothetical protein